MTAGDVLLLWISRVLLRHALQVWPSSSLNWAAAAANEIAYVKGPGESLRWSIGTVKASYQERLRSMSLRDPQIPRPILLLEVLICFVPASCLWICSSSAVVRNIVPLPDGICLITAASVGPIGLTTFGRLLFGKPSLRHQRWRLVLTWSACWTATVFLLSPVTTIPLSGLPWRDCVLLLLLPLVGAAHYSLLAQNTHFRSDAKVPELP
jgi:hypothetical protein